MQREVPKSEVCKKLPRSERTVSTGILVPETPNRLCRRKQCFAACPDICCWPGSSFVLHRCGSSWARCRYRSLPALTQVFHTPSVRHFVEHAVSGLQHRGSIVMLLSATPHTMDCAVRRLAICLPAASSSGRKLMICLSRAFP